MTKRIFMLRTYDFLFVTLKVNNFFFHVESKRIKDKKRLLINVLRN